MKYRRANEVLPGELLAEIQKHVSGEALYFPKYDGRKQWGENTGAKAYYKQRNSEIRERHARGISLEALAGQYSLSVETVRKIIKTAVK